MQEISKTVDTFLRAGIGGVQIISKDEIDLVRALKADLPAAEIWCWSLATPAFEARTGQRRTQAAVESVGDLIKSLREMTGAANRHRVILLLGADDVADGDAFLRRALVETKLKAREHGHLLCLVSHRAEDMHADLTDEFSVVKHRLPSVERLEETLADFVKTSRVPGAHDLRAAALALAGLTASRAEDLFARAALQRDTSVDRLMDLKITDLGSRPYLTIEKPSTSLDDLIGHASFKGWLQKRRRSVLGGSKLRSPKGVLLAGPPGTGKSRFASAIAKSYGISWLTLDASALYGKYLGESEERLNDALEIAEGMAPCVFLMDEVERAFPDSNKGGGDSGTSERVLGKLLTWLAMPREKTVFTVMTSNFPQYLPAALTRKGRLDETWLLDFPAADERLSIVRYYLSRLPIPHEAFDEREFLNKSELFSPAEIEHAVFSAAIEAEDAETPVSWSLLGRELDLITPVAKTYEDDVRLMRSWAIKNARPTT